MRPVRRVLPVLFLLLASGCRGTAPAHYGDSRLGFGAVLVGARLLLPTGESGAGDMRINLESKAERYRLRLEPGETSLFRVEPDIYRLHPSRRLFGGIQRHLRVSIAGRTYRVPFPRDILRKEAVDVRPTKVVPIGVLEARLLPIRRGRSPKIELRLDDSLEARRRLIEHVIAMQMDPDTPPRIRDSSISWVRALEQALIRIQGEQEAKPSYKPSQ
ncbi:MAG: hypothetical protein ABII00_00645 [Elusimicrobiota bacterium]